MSPRSPARMRRNLAWMQGKRGGGLGAGTGVLLVPPPIQENSSSPKATASGRTRPFAMRGKGGPASGTDRSEAEPESTRSPEARRPKQLEG